MDETKKKKPEEEGNLEDKPKETSADEKAEEPKSEEKPKDEADKPDEKQEKDSDDKVSEHTSQADENGEGAASEKADEKEDKPEEPKAAEETAGPDPKDEEILKLKTQISAMQMGFKPECMEDAVVLAESYVKSGAEKDINSALSAVMKKYADWKADGGKSDSKKSGGFKVGAGDPEKKPTDDERLNKAFGIKSKGK